MFSEFESLLDKYSSNPDAVTVPDVIPLVHYIRSKQVGIPADYMDEVFEDHKPQFTQNIQAVLALSAEHQVSTTSIITIGIHGNEILCGALCVLEILLQWRRGQLKGNVIIQLGNVKAIDGFLGAYNPEIYFLERNGWRETNGVEREVLSVQVDDNKSIDIMSDLNRTPSMAMHMPRGLHYVVDRTQELVWLYKAFLKGFVIDEEGVLTPSSQPYDVKLLLYPHTSRMIGGIHNLTMPKATSIAFREGVYDSILLNVPKPLQNILWWTGNGLGGVENVIFDQLIEDEHLKHNPDHTQLPLILTVEFGNHEDIRPPSFPSLGELCGPLTKSLLENSDMILNKSPVQEQPDFKIIYTNPVRLSLSYFKDADTIEKNDKVYLVCEDKTINQPASYIQEHFPQSILVYENLEYELILTNNLPPDSHARVFYCMPRFELDSVDQDQPIMIALGPDKKAKFISAPHDMVAVLTGDPILEFPILSWDNDYLMSQLIFFAGSMNISNIEHDK